MRKFEPNSPIEDNYLDTPLEQDDEIIIPQDDLYSIAWEADFGPTPFETEHDNAQAESTRPAETEENSQPTTEWNGWSVSSRDDNSAPTTNENDVTNTTRDEQNGPHLVNSDVTEQINPNPNAPQVHDENDVTASPNDQTSTRTKNSKSNSEGNGNNSPNSGGDITVPGISGNENELHEENTSPRGGK